jgi:hypothetical protein
MTYQPICQLLPPDARHRLVAASKAGLPESDERNKAVDDAITFAKLHFPYFFKPENLK